MEAMVDLTMHAADGPVTIGDIARRQKISPNYLEQILVQLRAAGLVRSLRGAAGGFVLGKSPSEIRMSEIATVFEGPIDLIGCAIDADTCRRSASCAVREIWVEVGECMKQALDSVTLQEVAALQVVRNAGSQPK